MISALLVTTLLGSSPGPEVGSAIQTVRRAFLDEGTDRVARTPTHRVISHADGSLELQGLQPLRVSLQSIQRERGAACRAALISRETSARTITASRACGLHETWTNEPEGLAHAFVVRRAPEGSGGLTLRLSVEGPWHHQDDQGHVFAGPGAAALLRYGNAFVVRDGRRVPVPVVRVEGGLELRIPSALVEAPHAFPMIIDPLLSAEVPLDPNLTFTAPLTDEEKPAIAVNSAGVAMVVWVDGRRQVSTDIYGARLGTGGSLLEPAGLAIAVGAGNQQRPTICATGTSFVVAWDVGVPDGGFQVRARPVAANGAVGTELFIGAGSQPSVATVADAGVYLAMVDPDSTVQIIPIRGNTVGAAVPRMTSGTVDTSSRPVITSAGSGWFVAWESTPPFGTVSSIKGLFSSDLQEFTVFDNQSSLSAVRPSAALVPQISGREAFVFWEEGPDVRGARVDGNSSQDFAFGGYSSPSLVINTTTPGALPTLGMFSGNGFKLVDLNDGGVSAFQVGLRPRELALAYGGRLFGAWTQTTLTGSDDVVGALISPVAANTQPIPISRAANAQRGAQVAMRDGLGEGLAVWLEGRTRIRAAQVRVDPNGLVVGPVYPLVDLLSPIDQLAVSASGPRDTYLVTWRTQTGSVGAQLATVSSSIGTPLLLGAVGGNAGPAVAWNETTSAFVVAWGRASAGGFEVLSRTVTLGGTSSGDLTHALQEANEVALTCLPSDCLLAWERPNLGVVAMLLNSLGPPALVRVRGTQPAVAHDGQDFFVGWRSDNTLKFARVDAVLGIATDLQAGPIVSSNATGGRFSLASAQPPIVSWSEVSASEETNVYLHRVDFQGPAQHVALGFSPSVATSGVFPDASGVIVYQRFVSSDGVQSVRAFGTRFVFSTDAGTPDAGTPDGGEVDGGEVDAGFVDAGPGSSDAGLDAGTAADGGPMIFETTGCTCQSVSPASLVLLLGLLAMRRRRLPTSLTVVSPVRPAVK